MARFVIGPDVALRLATTSAKISPADKMMAPTLMRSQLLSMLYGEVARGVLDRKAADTALAYLQTLKLRFLGDRTLQRHAWTVAEQLAWPDTYHAEYIALTKLQADAFVTLDKELEELVKNIVPVVPIEQLLDVTAQR
ncbi:MULTISPECIES: hypothetical protein [unclassified Rhizobium]|jgi:predicted nucleic acid-binding protein|uniref:type II toxin-antitoxin system VapC family toxin n=1 Tax=unclassified Rhizobium TaxID=2613769 RepID=UPI0006478A1C|nr:MULTISPECIES: hypothetical protein [unclassified Rhizobium]MBN8953960.1 hypothetical protein [Rhizobium tropici]OJY72191.1 MAG: hypothetical protein BGP09_06110 [Rhizobium sp. 60-20]RKD50960.1 hypothetical protein BJ928_11854 [Rhizobium sp. WW_1]